MVDVCTKVATEELKQENKTYYYISDHTKISPPATHILYIMCNTQHMPIQSMYQTIYFDIKRKRERER